MRLRHVLGGALALALGLAATAAQAVTLRFHIEADAIGYLNHISFDQTWEVGPASLIGERSLLAGGTASAVPTAFFDTAGLPPGPVDARLIDYGAAGQTVLLSRTSYALGGPGFTLGDHPLFRFQEFRLGGGAFDFVGGFTPETFESDVVRLFAQAPRLTFFLLEGDGFQDGDVFWGTKHYRYYDSYMGTATFLGVVPEPGTWTLMIGGFGLAGAALRRRSRRAAA